MLLFTKLFVRKGPARIQPSFSISKCLICCIYHLWMWLCLCETPRSRKGGGRELELGTKSSPDWAVPPWAEHSLGEQETWLDIGILQHCWGRNWRQRAEPVEAGGVSKVRRALTAISLSFGLTSKQTNLRFCHIVSHRIATSKSVQRPLREELTRRNRWLSHNGGGVAGCMKLFYEAPLESALASVLRNTIGFFSPFPPQHPSFVSSSSCFSILPPSP